MKAIIEVAPPGSIFRTALQQFVESGVGKAPDYRLSFESAKTLFANLTPARLALMDTLRRIGPCTHAALARARARARALVTVDSDIQSEIARLEFLGLVERDEAGDLTVPYEADEIILPLAQVA
jgi:predicted transcriptional regulator